MEDKGALLKPLPPTPTVLHSGLLTAMFRDTGNSLWMGGVLLGSNEYVGKTRGLQTSWLKPHLSFLN